MRPRPGSDAEKIELNMTPMIDVVFQLLTFFIMSLNITATEGDFQVRMPQRGRAAAVDKQHVAFQVRMMSHHDGTLRSLSIDGHPLVTDVRTDADARQAFDKLHEELLARLGDERGPGSLAGAAEVVFDCDYALDYEHVIRAITAVGGYVSPSDSKSVVKLIEKIKFAPTRANRL